MNKDVVNIIFGDSIAYGLCDDELGWVNRIRKHNDKMLKSFYCNLGIPGQNSYDIVKRFEVEFANRYNEEDIFNLFFSFGINDTLLLNENIGHIDVFKNNIEYLIKTSKKYTNHIYFLGLLDVDLTKRNEYKQENINSIDNLLEKICNDNNVKYINMKNIVKIEDLTDGLHPNSNGHQAIANYIYDAVYKDKI